MMADAIEHVISYWMIYQKFQSPALGGYAVISHWLPFLLFSVYSGVLADRFDPRRIIQLGMVLYMLCSLVWGVLFRGPARNLARGGDPFRLRNRRRLVGAILPGPCP